MKAQGVDTMLYSGPFTSYFITRYFCLSLRLNSSSYFNPNMTPDFEITPPLKRPGSESQGLFRTSIGHAQAGRVISFVWYLWTQHPHYRGPRVASTQVLPRPYFSCLNQCCLNSASTYPNKDDKHYLRNSLLIVYFYRKVIQPAFSDEALQYTAYATAQHTYDIIRDWVFLFRNGFWACLPWSFPGPITLHA